MQAQAPQYYAAGGSPNGSHSAAVNPPEEITKVAEDFCNRYPVDANAMDYLLTSTPEVQARVVQEFRPPREGEGDYSALLTAFVKRCRGAARGAGAPPQAMHSQHSAPAPGGTIVGAGGQLLTLSPDGVYVEVQPGHEAMKPMHGGGYGGRQEQRYGGGGGMPIEQPLPGTLDAFLLRYPLDERALDYFSCQRAEVQERVLQDFRPPREGDNDYSSLFMSFVKRCRGDASRAAAGGTGGLQQPMGFNPSVQRPLVFATPAPLRQGGGAYTSGAAFGQAPQPSTSTAGGLDALAARYPIDDRAYDYFSTCSADVQERVLRDFRPPREGEADYSSLFMAFVKRCRGGRQERQDFYQQPQYAPAPQMQPQYQGAYNGGSGLGGTGSLLNSGPEGLEAFRQRFPIDERAMAYLSESSAEVRERVLNTFVPPQTDDMDFSAPVTAYVRECRRLLDTGLGGQAVQPSQDPGVGAYGGFTSPGAYGAAGGVANAAPDGLSDEMNAFLARFPVDARAVDYLSTSSASVQARVIREFAPKQEGDADYSPLVMAFTKRIKGEERGIPAPGGFPEPPWKRPRAY